MKLRKRLLIVFIISAIVLTAAAALSGCNIFDLFSTKINLEFRSELVLEDTYFQYTSQEITPEVTLYHRDEVVSPEYYTLVYADNIRPGTAKVTATGKNGYYGEISAEFYISYIYTFDVNGASEVDGDVVQNVFSKSDLKAPSVNKLGYTFSHWTCGSQIVNFDDIDSLPDSGEFVANYTLDIYNIKYELNGGVNSLGNKTTYTVEDIFELKNPTLSGKRFGGWFTDENFLSRITSLEGYSQNLTLYAKFGDYSYREITYVVPDGAKEVPYDLLLPETPLYYPAEQTMTIDGKEKRLVWYLDETCYYKYVFREMPDEDITVYARWEDVVPAGFLDKIDRFSAASVTLYSYQDLVDYIDYIYFNNIVVRKDINGEYDWSSFNWVLLNYESSESIDSQIKQALNVDCVFPIMNTVTFVKQEGRSIKIALSNDLTGSEALISATSENMLIPQYGNIFALQSSGRWSNYDKFPIDYVEKTCAVTTSNQLFYVLACGYRPLPTAGSKAEYIYDYFREVMRGICNDSMSDLEKVRAIYEWLILNVQYDYVIVDMNVDTADTHLYDAFYLEGVVNGVAVCDGLSKAFCVMCAIERIDCVRVIGESIYDGVGHAWNKVQILGEWFVSDVTWGNAEVVKDASQSYEYITYQYLLFSDADRTDFIHQSFTDFVANKKFDLGLYYSYLDLQVGSYDIDIDFYIESEEEFSYILEYIELNYGLDEVSGMTFSVVLDAALVEKLSATIDGVEKTLFQTAMEIYGDRNPRSGIHSIRIVPLAEECFELVYIMT